MFGYSFMNYRALEYAVNVRDVSIFAFAQYWYNIKHKTIHAYPYGVCVSVFDDSNMVFLGFSRWNCEC